MCSGIGDAVDALHARVLGRRDGEPELLLERSGKRAMQRASIKVLAEEHSRIPMHDSLVVFDVSDACVECPVFCHQLVGGEKD